MIDILNDGIPNSIVSLTEEIATKVQETEDEFIIDTIYPYCADVANDMVRRHISKKELKRAILKYYGKSEPNKGTTFKERVKILEDYHKWLDEENANHEAVLSDSASALIAYLEIKGLLRGGSSQ